MTSARSALINQALMRIPRRADSVDRATLVRTFVALGPLFAMLGSVDHQVLFGRRGTGKTHALLCLADMVEQGGDVPVYIDLRTIGSAGGLYSDPQERYHVLFGPLGRALRGIADSLGGARLWILLDEWSSLPAELQPFLADLLRRSLFPVRGITVKIAAIQRRSRFRDARENADYLGIEVGADAAAGLDLDDFLIVGREEEHAQSFLRSLLFNHVIAYAAHPERLGRAAASPSDFIQAAFKKNAFPEFVRAAEGIPRDAINLAALAAQYADHASIGIQEVRRAASEWYQRDKQAAITANAAAQQLLRELIDEVVGRRKARTFLLDQTAYHEHLAIQDLCDARLLHVLRHGITMPNRPGTRYDGFAIDYGCYVALLFSEQDFKQSSGWYDTWLRARPDVAPDNFHDIERSLIHLARLDRTR